MAKTVPTSYVVKPLFADVLRRLGDTDSERLRGLYELALKAKPSERGPARTVRGRVDAETHAAVKAIAEESGRTITELFDEILADSEPPTRS